MSDWLKISKKMNENALKGKDLVCEIGRDVFDCTIQMGSMGHAIVLSYYYLLRHASYVEANRNDIKTDFYHDAIR